MSRFQQSKDGFIFVIVKNTNKGDDIRPNWQRVIAETTRYNRGPRGNACALKPILCQCHHLRQIKKGHLNIWMGLGTGRQEHTRATPDIHDMLRLRKGQACEDFVTYKILRLRHQMRIALCRSRIFRRGGPKNIGPKPCKVWVCFPPKKPFGRAQIAI